MLVVSFAVGRQAYGLPVADVQEVVPLPALVSLVGAPPFLRGLLNLRGQYVPVLDARVLLGEPALISLDSQIVIAGRGGPELGLLVDQVSDVELYARQATTLGPDAAAPFLGGVINAGEQAILLLEIAALVELLPSFAQSVLIEGETRS